MEGFTNHLIGGNYRLLRLELQVAQITQILIDYADYLIVNLRNLWVRFYFMTRLHSHIVRNNP
jgi:hypothetical protein